VTDFPPLTTHGDLAAWRPKDAAYDAYASLHVRDLIARYSPDVLWNDINWPNAGSGRDHGRCTLPGASHNATPSWCLVVGTT
jgi:hypothetical protein